MTLFAGDFSGRPITLRLVVTQQSQNTTNNSSRVWWDLYAVKTGNTTAWSNWPANWHVNIDGQNWNGTWTYNYSSQTEILIDSGWRDVYHNANGTKTITVAADAQDPQGNLGSASLSNSMALTTIPRMSVATYSASAVDAGTSVRINTNRASTSFSHTARYEFGPNTGTIATGIIDFYDWTPPTSLLTAIPTLTQAYARIYLDTYSGGTLIGTTSSLLTIRVPASAVPTLSTVTATEATTGVAANVGAFVQGVSKLAVAASGAAGVYGSTISSYKITVDGQVVNASSGTTGVIKSSGAMNVVGTVTDSRGRTASKTLAINVLAYAPPIARSVTFDRATSAGVVATDTGTSVRVSINATASSLINTTQRNALVYKISSRIRGTTTWTLNKTVTAPSLTFNSFDVVSTFPLTSAYDFLVEVSDDFNKTSVQGSISTASVLMHWGDQGEGVGIGKFWIAGRGSLDVLGQIYQNDGKAVIDTADVATASVAGITTLASDAEVLAATVTNKAVVPASLKARTTGTFAFNGNGFYKNSASTYTPITIWKRQDRAYFAGTATNAIAITFAGNTVYSLGTIPTGFRPAKQLFIPSAVSPIIAGSSWLLVNPTTGDVSFALENGITLNGADQWQLSFSIEWDI
jgi:hypothetical protein